MNCIFIPDIVMVFHTRYWHSHHSFVVFQVIIGEDGNPSSSRGRRVLGGGAMLAAYLLFAIVGVTVVLCGAFVYDAFNTK